MICSALTVLAILTVLTTFSQRSPFNNLDVLPVDSTGHYRILIGGHFHGESTNRSGYPAATLLANIDTINKLGANLFLSAGDLFMDPAKDQERYERSIFSKLKMPLFNAPGNHDAVTDHVPMIFEMPEEALDGISKFRQVWGMITDRVLVLDLEASDGSLTERDILSLEKFNRESQLVTHVEVVRRVFIVTHRPIWAEDDPRYSSLFEGNTRSATGTNFKKDMYPLLEKIAQHAHVYWISGSMGGFAPSSIFFQEHAKNITYIQCAIRDEPRDALLIADVYPDTVKWSSFSLTGQKLLAPEKYDAAWWRAHLGEGHEGFKWRLLPYMIKTTVLRKEFWWGAFGGALLLMLVRRLYRRS